MKRVAVERPDVDGVKPEVLEYIGVLELMAYSKNAQEPKNPLNPRHWPAATHLAIVVSVIGLFVWVWNRGGDWKQIENTQAALQLRQTAIELRLDSFEKTYARRDLLEQQMNYMLKGLDELKVKVDQLTAARR